MKEILSMCPAPSFANLGHVLGFSHLSQAERGQAPHRSPQEVWEVYE